jgi:hypothetical protein
MHVGKAVLLAVVVGCASPAAVAPAVQASAACGDRACLEAHEGKAIDVEGTFRFPEDPERKGKHRYRLVLGDGTAIMLPHPKELGAMGAKLSRDHDGKRLVARGLVYVKPMNIPEKYGIIQSTADPQLVELYDVKIGP